MNFEKAIIKDAVSGAGAQALTAGAARWPLWGSARAAPRRTQPFQQAPTHAPQGAAETCRQNGGTSGTACAIKGRTLHSSCEREEWQKMWETALQGERKRRMCSWHRSRDPSAAQGEEYGDAGCHPAANGEPTSEAGGHEVLPYPVFSPALYQTMKMWHISCSPLFFIISIKIRNLFALYIVSCANGVMSFRTLSFYGYLLLHFTSVFCIYL